MQNSFSLSVLHLMYDEARKTLPPSRGRIAKLLGASVGDVDEALAVLERAGLVDARRATLTFPGLAVAAASRASSQSRGSVRVMAA
jgi:Mn-dependent DtxR family transcriptional regulator